nr:hypothetical protein [Tanacetum cinerariifolium]
HQDAVLDTADQLRHRLIARLDVEVGHSVDGRPVPATGATVGNAFHAGAVLRQRATQWAFEDAVLDQELLAGGCAVVVIAIARQLLGNLRVEGHVEQARAVLQAAKVAGFDEAGAGVVALVAEDPVQFQRMADGLVDLQDHLVRRQQQVTWAGRGVGRQDQLQRLIGNVGRRANDAARGDDFRAALLAEVLATQAAGLAVFAVIGRDAEAGEYKALSLTDLGARAVEVDLRWSGWVRGSRRGWSRPPARAGRAASAGRAGGPAFRPVPARSVDPVARGRWWPHRLRRHGYAP